MIDPCLELHAAIVAAFRASAAMQALVGVLPAAAQRIYDEVPEAAARLADTGAAFPYVNLGQPQKLPDRADCVDGSEIAWPLHGWSRTEGQSIEIKQLGAAMESALDQVEFTLPSHRVVLAELEQTIYLDDPDGITKHVVVTMRFLTEPTV